MFEGLAYRKAISIIKKYDTEGHTPLQIIADDYSTYVLKFPNNSNDKYSIAKEFICHYLLKCWSIPTPDIAALSVNAETLNQCPIITNREKRLIDESASFGSRLILNAVELMNFIAAENATTQKKIINTEDILKIALFDIWVENDDRKPTNNNILLNPSGKGFILNAIDHAFTFSSLDFKELNYSEVCFSDNDSILYTPLAKSIIKKRKFNRADSTQLEEIFYLCIQNVKSNFDKIAVNLPVNLNFTDKDKVFLSNFLFNQQRNTTVFQNFCYIINSIKQ